MEAILGGIKGIGPNRLKALGSAGIKTYSDIWNYLPRTYRDLSHPTALCDVSAGSEYYMRVSVVSPATEVRVKKLLITRCMVSDGTDALNCVWFNQPWLKKSLFVGKELPIYGRVEQKNGRMQISCPSIETETGLVPIYKPINGIPPKTLRQIISAAIEALPDLSDFELPDEIIERFALCDLVFAYRNAHFPSNREALSRALYRLTFENLLMFQLAVGMMRMGERSGDIIESSPSDMEEYWKTLPLPPTNAQAAALLEIAADMNAPTPMARMVQGDVGCGKTAVAFGAIYLACRAGFQCAMMAPTEILARQHYENALNTLAPHGIKCGLLVGALTEKEHRIAREKLISGEWTCVFGTHALITPQVKYKNLGLVITDEQHRFGVRQRTLLSEKGAQPNVLVMSATPIPRTLALILYGDLDISVIGEMPPGRIPVKTRIVPERKRADMYSFIRQQVKKGFQCYFVCPLVEESEAVDARSAQLLFDDLRESSLPDLRIQMVHGKMKQSEKDAAIESFRRAETDVLVSTTVIEVGVNVPNATVMVIENAERFGLAQLHQLRGRVGRGSDESWCFLMSDSNSKLKILADTNDGFKIAETDMRLRGPGDMFGTRQSGSVFEFASEDSTDAQTLKITHDLARELLHRECGDSVSERVIQMAHDYMNKRSDRSFAAY